MTENPYFIHKDYRLLVADDEENTRTALARALQLMGYEVDEAANGSQVLEKLSQRCFDLLLLDLRMPEVDGTQVMQHIRQQNLDIAIIILTAHATLDSAIAAVKAGAHDYLLKPQHTRQIVDVVQQALVSRLQFTAAPADSGNPSHCPVRLDLDGERRSLTITNADATRKQVELTADQCNILTCFMEHPKKVLTSVQIAQDALSYSDLTKKEAESIIRPHVLRLRRKIEHGPHYPLLLRTVRGVGYIYIPPDSDPCKTARS